MHIASVVIAADQRKRRYSQQQKSGKGAVLEAQRNMFIVGLTGGIATGKSTVSEILRSFGCLIIDSDKIAREGKKRKARQLVQNILGQIKKIPGFSSEILEKVNEA